MNKLKRVLATAGSGAILALSMAGGAFNKATGSYAENTVVYAFMVK